MTKYKEYYQKMLTDHAVEFAAFRKVHDDFAANKVTQDEYNKVGRKIQDIIRDYEDRLCGHSESGQYGKFSSSLADKFWDLIRLDFPKIDYIGVISK